MVRLFPVKSINSVDTSEVNSSRSSSDDQTNYKNKRPPNRFKGETFYDRSVFNTVEDCFPKSVTVCDTKGCECLKCSELPLVILSSSDHMSNNLDDVNLQNIEEFVDGGVLEPLLESSFFIYSQLDLEGKEQFGVLAAIDVDDCTNRIVKPHENILDQHELVMQHDPLDGDASPTVCFVKKQFSSTIDPVLLMYRENNEINDLVQRIVTSQDPIMHSSSPSDEPHHSEADLYGHERKDEDSRRNHQLWAISSCKDIECVKEAFAAVDSLYIADGHHRTAAACSSLSLSDSDEPPQNVIKSSRYLTALLFPHTQLSVLSYNRAVRTLNGLTKEAFLERVSERFIVQRLIDTLPAGDRTTPEKKPVSRVPLGIAERTEQGISMYLPGCWYSLELRPSVDCEEQKSEKDTEKEETAASVNGTAAPNKSEDCPLSKVGAQILLTYLLKPILEIEAPHNKDCMIYVDGREAVDGLVARVDGGEAAVAFAVDVVSVEQIMKVADAGLLMPPKATFFSPKPKPGFMKRLNR